MRWLLLCAWCVAGGAAAAAPPSPLQGTREVVQVAVDQRDQPHWAWFPDDVAHESIRQRRRFRDAVCTLHTYRCP